MSAKTNDEKPEFSSVFDSSLDDLSRISYLLKECSDIYPNMRLSSAHYAYYEEKKVFPIVAFFYKLKEAYRLFSPMDILSDEVLALFDEVEKVVVAYDVGCRKALNSPMAIQRANPKNYIPSQELLELLEQLYLRIINARYALNLGIRRKQNFGNKRSELRSRFKQGRLGADEETA